MLREARLLFAALAAAALMSPGGPRKAIRGGRRRDRLPMYWAPVPRPAYPPIVEPPTFTGRRLEELQKAAARRRRLKQRAA